MMADMQNTISYRVSSATGGTIKPMTTHRSLTGHKNIDELISRSNRKTVAPMSIQPTRKRRRKKIDSRITTGFIGILLGAMGHALITRK